MTPLIQRMVTAVCLVLVLVVLLFAAPAAISIGVLALVMLLAAWEWSAFVGLRRTRFRLAYVVAVGAVLFWLQSMVPSRLDLLPVLIVGLAWWAAAFLWVLRFPTAIPPAVAAAAGVLVLAPAWLVLAALLSLETRGAALLMLVLSIVWAADIGAYFVGRRAGRVKLAPKVSPGKTWEGLVGGLAAASIAAAAGGAVLGFPLAVAVPMGLVVGGISVVGDLTESMFKRNVGLKDSGWLFPGHGGVLDRIDSVTAAAPLFALILYWVERLP